MTGRELLKSIRSRRMELSALFSNAPLYGDEKIHLIDLEVMSKDEVQTLFNIMLSIMKDLTEVQDET